MAKDWDVKLNIPGFVELRTSQKVEDHLLKLGQRVADACGEGYKAEVAPSKRRARVTVFPDSNAARLREASQNNLVRNLDAARE